MEFRTITDLPDNLPRINHNEHILMLGSCFSDNIGERLRRAMFPVTINPFGTLYNPESIAMAIDRMLDGKPYQAEELIFHNGLWHSFAHHSRFSSVNPDNALRKINREFTDSVESLKHLKHLFVTFGTAYAFRLKETGKIAANCHKMPAALFIRERMSVNDITDRWIPLIDRLFGLNPTLEVTFTVSPIRHLADGARQNTLSKATLLLASETITSHDRRCHYFPAFEIMNDELRDYRFYAADMTHPTEVAVDYIMERFSDACFSEQTRRDAASCEKLYRRICHHPLTDDTEAIEKFRTSTRQAANELADRLPHIRQTIENLFSK